MCRRPTRAGMERPKRDPSRQSVLWLEHADQHYRWLKPKGPDTVLDKAVTSTATTVDASSMPMSHLAAFSASEARPRLESAVLESSLVWELPLPPRQLPQSCWALPLRATTTWTTPLASFTTAPVAGLCPLACEATAPTLLLWHTGASQNVRRRVALKGLAASEPRRERAWKAFQPHLSKLQGAK